MWAEVDINFRGLIVCIITLSGIWYSFHSTEYILATIIWQTTRCLLLFAILKVPFGTFASGGSDRFFRRFLQAPIWHWLVFFRSLLLDPWERNLLCQFIVRLHEGETKLYHRVIIRIVKDAHMDIETSKVTWGIITLNSIFIQMCL